MSMKTLTFVAALWLGGALASCNLCADADGTFDTSRCFIFLCSPLRGCGSLSVEVGESCEIRSKFGNPVGQTCVCTRNATNACRCSGPPTSSTTTATLSDTTSLSFSSSPSPSTVSLQRSAVANATVIFSADSVTAASTDEALASWVVPVAAALSALCVLVVVVAAVACVALQKRCAASGGAISVVTPDLAGGASSSQHYSSHSPSPSAAPTLRSMTSTYGVLPHPTTAAFDASSRQYDAATDPLVF